MPIALITIWKVIRPILTFGITLPVWLFLVAGGWFWWDKTSAVRTAVNNAVTELVAGAEMDALKAKLAEEARRRQAAAKALDDYRKQSVIDHAVAEQANDLLEQRIAENEKTLAAAGRSCLLDDADVDWLRNATKSSASGGR